MEIPAYLLIPATLLFSVAGYPRNCPRIVSRDEWGARPPKEPPEHLAISPVPFTVAHHGGIATYCFNQSSCSEQVRAYQDLHMDNNSWNDIGYNFVVGEDGNVYEGRGWDSIGAHAPGYNDHSIGICIVGDFTGRLPNDLAISAVQQLIQCGVEIGKITTDYQLLGHRQAKDTECPGEAYFQLITTWPHWTADPVPSRIFP